MTPICRNHFHCKHILEKMFQRSVSFFKNIYCTCRSQWEVINFGPELIFTVLTIFTRPSFHVCSEGLGMKLPLAYRIAGKCGGVFNLVIWWSGDVMSLFCLSLGRNFVLLTRFAHGVLPRSTTNTLQRGQRWEGVPTKMALPRPFLSLKSQATRTWSTMRLGLHCSSESDVTFWSWGPESPNLNLSN